MKCLSRMTGNCHVRFLGGKAVVTPLTQPIIATSIATPVGGLFMLLMIWRNDLSVGYKKPTVLRICMTISYIFAVIMTISGLSTQIPKIIALFA